MWEHKSDVFPLTLLKTSFVKQAIFKIEKMKKILYLLIVLFVPVFLSSCYDFPMNRLGFHSAFDNDSNGVTIARVDRFTDYIYL